MSSTNNNNPTGQVATSGIGRSDEITDLIIDNMLKRTQTNHLLLMAYMEEMRNNQMDIANLLRLNPSAQVRQSNLAKLAAVNYSTDTFNAQFVPQINTAPALNAITSAATVESITANANNVNEQPEVSNASNSSTVFPGITTTNSVTGSGSGTSSFVNSKRKRVPENEKFTVRKLECTEENCDEEFESMSKLEEHLGSRMHRIGHHRCPQKGCKFSTGSKAQLIDHKNQKHSSAIYQCKVCERRFNQIASCKDRFESLLKHYKDNHYHGEYVCTICKRETNTLAQAKAHYDQCSNLIRKPVNVSITPYQALPDPYRFAQPSSSSQAPINFSVNSTTINNTYNQQLQSRTPKQPVANTNSVQQIQGTKVVKQTPMDLTKQKQQTVNPSPSRPVRKSTFTTSSSSSSSSRTTQTPFKNLNTGHRKSIFSTQERLKRGHVRN